MLFLYLALVAAVPGLMLLIAMLSFSSRWNKVFALTVFVALTLVYRYLTGTGEDDSFGLGAFIGYGYVIFILLFAALGWATRAWLERRSRRYGEDTAERGWVDPDIAFAILLAFTIPLYPLFYGWFAGIGGAVLFPVLAVGIVVLAGGFLAGPRGPAGRIGAVRMFFGASALAWLVLAGYSLHTGTVVEDRAREVAAGAPYCQESRQRKLLSAWDMTILNMRVWRSFSPHVSGFSGQLVVLRNGQLERYHWSHRASDFHGNGNVFSGSICLVEFGSSEKRERENGTEVKLRYTPQAIRDSNTRGPSAAAIAISWLLLLAAPLFVFACHLAVDRNARRVVVVITYISLAVYILCGLASRGPILRPGFFTRPWLDFAMIGIAPIIAFTLRRWVFERRRDLKP